MTRVVRSVDELRDYVDWARRNRYSIGFVPTLGALHEGHLSLMRRSWDDNDLSVVSIYVNPLQFGPDEDLERYPRDLEGDLAKCESAHVDVVFAPTRATMLPPGSCTTVHVAGVTSDFEGALRPGHFDGVATVVARLLALAEPDRAYFGRKDYQQTVVIRRMVRDLGFRTEVVVCPTQRDADGLALSSRNAYLTPEDREQALLLPRALEAAEAAIAGGETDGDVLRDLMADAMESDREDVEVEYADLVHPDTLQPLPAIETRGVLLGALRVGATRLIDNRPVERPGTAAWEA